MTCREVASLGKLLLCVTINTALEISGMTNAGLDKNYLYSMPGAFNATTEAHGLYSTSQFVLRLSPLNHRTLEEAPKGIVSGGMSFKARQAMSTLLHETVHWWQHIGSTYGFVYGLNYPVQAHANFNELKTLIAGDGFRKSVLSQAERLNRHGPVGFGTLAGTANTIVNNHFDLETFRLFTLGPDFAREYGEDRRFENVGHAFHMTYAHTVAALASSVDEQLQVFPDFRTWQSGFEDLRNRRQPGHYYGSPIELWPIGSYEIFEGQARFAQIQFLSRTARQAGWEDFANIGMLDGVYVKAFQEFLRMIDSAWPASIDDPVVSLFLLVCDLSINPGSGFPATVVNFETFITDVHPGARFAFFCHHVAKSFPSMKRAIRLHNRDEYAELAGELSDANKDASPLLMAELFSKWFAPGGQLAHLRREFDTYEFDPKNYVVRHLLAHFLAFQQDKLAYPEFFCWPGFHMVGDSVTELAQELFERQGALFIDKEYDDSVFPRLQKGRSETIVDAAFQTFYANNVTYDLVRQWITEDGPFRYDIGWLKADSTRGQQANFMRQAFEAAFGVDPSSVRYFSEEDGVVAELKPQGRE